MSVSTQQKKRAIDAPNGDAVAKFCLALGSLGKVHTSTARAWPEAEYLKLVSELP